MKKNVIAIWGHAGQGKSDTVKKIAKLIIRYFPGATISNEELDYTKDIVVIITVGKYKIGIESQGDPNSRILRSIPLFVTEGCDMIICATRTAGETVNIVSNLNIKHGYEIIWATNYRSYEKDQLTMNEISASQIFDIIKEIHAGRL